MERHGCDDNAGVGVQVEKSAGARQLDFVYLYSTTYLTIDGTYAWLSVIADFVLFSIEGRGCRTGTIQEDCNDCNEASIAHAVMARKLAVDVRAQSTYSGAEATTESMQDACSRFGLDQSTSAPASTRYLTASVASLNALKVLPSSLQNSRDLRMRAELQIRPKKTIAFSWYRKVPLRSVE